VEGGIANGRPKGRSERSMDAAEGQLQARMVKAGVWL